MKKGRQDNILISLVTWNSDHSLESCIKSVLSQTVPVSIQVFDNDSRDSSVRIAKKYGLSIRVSNRNMGFSAGHNEVLRNNPFDYALILNPDVILQPSFIEKLIQSSSRVERCGMAGGKMYRTTPDGKFVQFGEQRIFDSTGMYMTPSLRHFDRGSEMPDAGEFQSRQLVFGITGAAMLVCRNFYEDASIGGEFFDEDFFAYREDADLAWRAQLMGWNCLYEPEAVAGHLRKVLPERRRDLSPDINFHSVKNRYLMRIKNMDRSVRLRCFPFMWLRDLGIFAYVPLVERTSLGAFSAVRKLKGRMLEKRREIQSRRRVEPKEMTAWFSFSPRAIKLNS
jgi:GT2 family glycosyltransferase